MNITVSEATSNERYWAAAAHLSALILALLTSWAVGIAGMLGAGIIYLIKRDDSAFITQHAREAINFNLSMFLYALASGILISILIFATIITLGLGIVIAGPIMVALWILGIVFAIAWLICSIIATTKALDGKAYIYPLTIRFIR